MSVYVGKLARVTCGTSSETGTYIVSELGAYAFDGFERDVLESTSFGDDIKEYVFTSADGGEIVFDGNYDPEDTTGQNYLNSFCKNSAYLSSGQIRFYIDNNSYYTVGNTDGSTWQQSYDSDEAYIYSLAVYSSTLYAAGFPSGKLYTYDGSSWVEDSTIDFDAYSLAAYDSKLYAGSGPNGIIFEYDGATWSESYTAADSYIYAMEEFDDNLYAAGFPSGGIYIYNGSSWSVGTSTDFDAYSLAAYDGKLYAGSGPNGIIFEYDGATWSESYTSSEPYIYSLVVYNSKLYAGTYPNGKILVFDGSNWSEYTSGDFDAYSLAVYNNVLYAGSGPNGIIFEYDGRGKLLITQIEQISFDKAGIGQIEFDATLSAGSLILI